MISFRLTRTPRLRPELPPADDPDLPAPSARTPSRDHVSRRSPDDTHVDDAHHVHVSFGFLTLDTEGPLSRRARPLLDRPRGFAPR